MKKVNLAVVGATGMVGRKVLEVLEQRNVAIDNFYAFASARSAGKKLEFMGKEHVIIELNEENIKKHPVDVAIFSAGGGTSATFAPIFAKVGTVVIDNSSYWRMDKSVPLVVPEVNSDALKHHNNIIANPNCSTIQAVVALAPLHRAFEIDRIVYSTYQAVSGSGVAGWADLENGLKAYNNKTKDEPKNYLKPIFNNVLPHIDSFLDSGYTKEEQKMIDETRKILCDDSLKITATTVRVPVFNSHSISINVNFKKSFKLEEVFEVLRSADGVVLMDDISKPLYPTALDTDGKDEVFVGRVRLDDSVKNGLNLWCVADNIRKGASTNAVQILEKLF